jgi:hypothetical protein
MLTHNYARFTKTSEDVGKKTYIICVLSQSILTAASEEMDKIMGSRPQRIDLIRVSSTVYLFKKMFLVVYLCL